MADEELPRCAVLGTLDLLHDLWTLGILRCVFYGIRRYTPIRQELGIATNVLAARLELLVGEGILERVPYQERPLRHEYVLTPKGDGLGPVIVGLRNWGAEHLAFAAPLAPLTHAGCGGEVSARVRCERCGSEVIPADIRGGPAAAAAAG